MKIIALFLLLAIALPGLAAPTDRSHVGALLTEYLKDPLGIDVTKPRFTWRMESSERDARQSTYQVQVATTREKLLAGKPDLWDSGRVDSAQSANVAYDGKPLGSRTAYFWRVRTWDGKTAPGAFSDPATFEMAILNSNEWRAKWVGVAARTSDPELNGYHSQFAASVESVKWVEIDLQSVRSFNTIVLYPARPFNWQHDDPGFGFPVRYRIEVSGEASFKAPSVIVDRTKDDQPNPGKSAVRIDVGSRRGRYVRLIATRLHHPKDAPGAMLALSEMEILDDKGKNIAYGKKVRAIDSIESSGWNARQLTDGNIAGIADRTPEGVIMRRGFMIDKPIARARAYVTGLGYCELRLNGRRVGDRVLDPARSSYDKRIYYSTYDVTKLLKQDANCAGALFGYGWWKKAPCFLLQLDMTFTDGTTASLISDKSWKWSEGPIRENSLYNGETYDARREQPGWDRAGFDDGKWNAAVAIPSPTRTLSAQMIQPIRVVATLAPRSMTEPKPGVYVLDFGQNIAGWCRISLSGPAGATVTIKHAEVLYPDGTVNRENLRSARAMDTYILSGRGDEIYEPRFTYHGFRYAQVEGFPGKLTKEAILACVVHTDMPSRGGFQCSNELLNRIQSNCRWTFLDNFHSIPTDCPQRDERQGWMGDAHVGAYFGLYNFDAYSAYTKFLRDIADAQGPEGHVPDTVPHVWGGAQGDPMWAGAYPFITWEMYRHTGDKRLLEEHYAGLRKYVESLRAEAKDDVLTRNTYSDWISVEPTPADLISDGTYYLTVNIQAKIAEALGKTQDAKAYRDLCTRIAAAFNARFYNPETGQYGNGSQFSNVFPLYLGIVPSERHGTIRQAMVTKIMQTDKGHLSTGTVGTRYIFDTLTLEGRPDVAYTIATQKSYPGYGYMIDNGATTIWELWQKATGNGMNSHNHPMLGTVSGWFFDSVAGIKPNPNLPGWRRFVVKPNVVGDLRWAKATMDTLCGRVYSRWERTQNGIRMNVTVPPNTQALICVPKLGSDSCAVREGGAVVWRDRYIPGVKGIHIASDSVNWIAFEVGAGAYEFQLVR